MHIFEEGLIVPAYVWGNKDEVTEDLMGQIKNACNTLVTHHHVALMPDFHLGYNVSIGTVVALENAVAPSFVGVDIACRMRMSIFDVGMSPVLYLLGYHDELKEALLLSTKFGVGAEYEYKLNHPVMDHPTWDTIPKAKALKDKAWGQLGTSGSGNHFAEWGVLTLPVPDLGLKAGQYLAFLTHSGSRGAGNVLATYYSKAAQQAQGDKELTWVSLDTELGQEYWAVMQLMGMYAAANHELIHKSIKEYIATDPVVEIENHHNFAWKENHFGKDVIVHRKGATPASKGTLGIIPGSMATPGFVVRGLGNVDSMDSASHGAGRAMSRKATKKNYTWEDGLKVLKEKGVELISSGLDEIPQGYKDIHSVMDAQKDLVDIVAQFDPKMVKMAQEGEQPED